MRKRSRRKVRRMTHTHEGISAPGVRKQLEQVRGNRRPSASETSRGSFPETSRQRCASVGRGVGRWVLFFSSWRLRGLGPIMASSSSKGTGQGGAMPESLDREAPARFLMLKGVLPSGLIKEASIKAVRRFRPLADGGGEFLKWELRRVFPAVGYVESKSMKNKDWEKAQGPLWEANFGHCKWKSNDHFGRAARAKTSSISAEQESWLSSPALLHNFCFWQQYRHGEGCKNMVECVGRWFLESTVLPTLKVNVQVLSADYKDVTCGRRNLVMPECNCVLEYRAELLKAANVPFHAQLWHAMSTMYKMGLQKNHECPILCLKLGEVLIFIGNEVDQRYSSWGKDDWMLTREAELHGPKGKRKRMDQDLRSYAVSGSLKQGKHGSPLEAVKAMPGERGNSKSVTDGWLMSEMAALRAQCMIDLGEFPQAISLIFDGVRGGNPGVEWNLWAATELYNQVHLVGGPQEHRCETVSRRLRTGCGLEVAFGKVKGPQRSFCF
jgi:hypothetical protein